MKKPLSLASIGVDALELVDRPWFPYLCTEVDFWQWRSSGDGHYNLWMALAGDGYLSCEGQTYRIVPGRFFVFSPEQQIVAMHYGGSRITRFSAHFFPLREGQRCEEVRGLPLLGGIVDSKRRIQRQIDAIMRIALRRDEDAVLARRLYELLDSLVSSAPGPEAELSGAVSEALRIFREEPSTVNSVDALAERLGLSRSHFDREFARQIGQPPRRFLINSRIIEARRYLESSQLRVGEIAEALGYRDVYFFSRQFKQIVGVPPGAYRRAHRG